jgi:A/G-specific adenine glycosylase
MSVSPSQVESPFAQSVLHWYRQHGRSDLPWQLDKTPYRVWLSEIMLQQTQVATVIPYYARFLKSFPSIQSLADASIDQVLQHWQGLGYYARARNLHRAAQTLRDEYGAQFPLQMDQAMALPGIGRSSAGAILSFSAGQSWPILDGNVRRLLARCFQVKGWYGQSKTMGQLWQIAGQLTPAEKTDEYNQAMMDLGAMVCQKARPKCEACPLPAYCASFKHNTQASFPEKKPTKTKPQKQTLMMLHRYQGQVLLYRRPPTGIWGGLWSLPEVESEDAIGEWQLSHLACTQLPGQIKTNILKHQFTHFRLDISLAVIDLDELPRKVADAENMVFVTMEQLADYGLPTPVKRILDDPRYKPIIDHSPAAE